MLCQLYSFASFVMLCIFSYPIVDSFTTISFDNSSAFSNESSESDQTSNTTDFNFVDNIDLSTGSRNRSKDEDLSASSSQLLTWIRSSNSDYVSVKPIDNENAANGANKNSSLSLKQLMNVFKSNADRREDTDLGLPPDIAHEYIDAVNPPKFRIPVQFPNHHYFTSSIAPAVGYENRLHAGSSVVKTKANYTSVPKPKPKELSGNSDLATLLRAELDAKKAELDQSKSLTPSPNLFALLPGAEKTDNPFLDSNYKTPNREKTSTSRPYVTSANSLNNFQNSLNNMKQFVYSEGLPSIRVTVPSYKPTIAITTPNSISLISTSPSTKLVVLRASTTARPIQSNKMKIKTKTVSTGSTRPIQLTTTRTTSTTTTKRPTVLTSTTIAVNNNNKSNDWSSRVSNQTNDRSSEANELTNPISGQRDGTGIQSQELYSTNTILRNNKNKKPLSEETTTESNGNKTDYNDLDYADNTGIAPNFTVPDGFADYPGANYRLTTERLAYILIGSCCALSILCLIVVAMSVRCRDMCDEYRSWKKAEKAALRWQRHQYRLAHHQQDLSRYFRTPVEPNPDSNVRTANGNVIAAPAPLFGQSCCHCISCSSSWLFRDVNKPGRDWCCQRGYYPHPTPRGKLPFGAASSVNTFMPRYANNSNSNNNYCDEHEGETDSLNTSDLIDSPHHRPQPQHHFGECPAPNSRPQQTTRQQLRRIAQPNGNQNWIHSSELVDELHKKHSNINNVSRDQTNMNNFRARNRQIGNENIVVWNNNNDERLI